MYNCWCFNLDIIHKQARDKVLTSLSLASLRLIWNSSMALWTLLWLSKCSSTLGKSDPHSERSSCNFKAKITHRYNWICVQNSYNTLWRSWWLWLTCISSTQLRRSWTNFMLTSSSVMLGSAREDFCKGLRICMCFNCLRLPGSMPPPPPPLPMKPWTEAGCRPGVMAGLKEGVRPGVRLEVNVEPGVPKPPGVRSGVRLELMFWEKPEFRLCVMPEIIRLVCSVVSVCPLLYTEEHSDLRESRSSRSCDTLHSKRHNNMRCKRPGKVSFF